TQATLQNRNGGDLAESELRWAAARVEGLPLDPAREYEVRAALLTAAVALLSGTAKTAGPPFLGCRWQERDLRLELAPCPPPPRTAPHPRRPRADPARRPRQCGAPPELAMTEYTVGHDSATPVDATSMVPGAGPGEWSALVQADRSWFDEVCRRGGPEAEILT